MNALTIIKNAKNGEEIEIFFPTDAETMQHVMTYLEPDDEDDLFIKRIWTDWDIIENNDNTKDLDINHLNYFMELLNESLDEDKELTLAIKEALFWKEDIDDNINYLLNKENYFFCREVYTDKDLGYYFIDEGLAEFPEIALRYFDYELYGRDIRLSGCGTHTDHGFIECSYVETLFDEVPEEYQVI